MLSNGLARTLKILIYTETKCGLSHFLLWLRLATAKIKPVKRVWLRGKPGYYCMKEETRAFVLGLSYFTSFKN